MHALRCQAKAMHRNALRQRSDQNSERTAYMMLAMPAMVMKLCDSDPALMQDCQPTGTHKYCSAQQYSTVCDSCIASRAEVMLESGWLQCRFGTSWLQCSTQRVLCWVIMM
jgi:hypothetical protein